MAGQELLSSSDGGDWVGPFTLNPTGTSLHAIGVDLLFPRGLYYAKDDGALESRTIQWEIQIQHLNPLEAPSEEAAEDWVSLATEQFTQNSTTAQRRSYRYPLPQNSQYQIRIRRIDQKDGSARSGHEIRWGGLRAYLTQPPNFGTLTLLALKMRASDNLSSRSSRLVNCIVTRKLTSWEQDPTTHQLLPQPTTPTRSIAWALADLCHAHYGGQLSEEKIDLPTLYQLHTLWKGRGDSFNAIFDQPLTLWEALIRVGRCGRVVPILQSGRIRFIRDQPQTLPLLRFTPNNIVKGSLSIHYRLPEPREEEGVTVEYFDEIHWKPATLTIYQQDEPSTPTTTPQTPSTNIPATTLQGITQRDQALREGRYLAATHRYRRQTITHDLSLQTQSTSPWSIQARVLAIRPRGEIIEITAINEDEKVHAY